MPFLEPGRWPPPLKDPPRARTPDGTGHPSGAHRPQKVYKEPSVGRPRKQVSPSQPQEMPIFKTICGENSLTNAMSVCAYNLLCLKAGYSGSPCSIPVCWFQSLVSPAEVPGNAVFSWGVAICTSDKQASRGSMQLLDGSEQS